MGSHRSDARSTPRRWAAVGAAVCLALVLWTSSRVRTAQVQILEPVLDTVVGRRVAPDSGVAPANVTGSTRSRVVRVNLYALPTPGTDARRQEDDIELNLFPDVTVRLVFEQFQTVGGSGTWLGHVENLPLSSATLSYRNGLLTASIHTSTGTFLIQPAPELEPLDGDARPLHVVRQIDTEALPRGADGIASPAPQDGRALGSGTGLDSGDTIDLMVVYTPTAMARNGGEIGINNLIALLVADANAAYQSSHINHRVRLVHTEAVPYTETNVFGRSYNDLYFGTNGLSGVGALRNAYGADLVSLLIGSLPGADFCGLGGYAAFPGLGASNGISVIGDGGCPSIFVLAHEMGHNMGARHDWYVEDSATPWPWGHGHVDLAGGWRTIMAYSDICRDSGVSCPPIRYFSTPEFEYLPFCATASANCDRLRYWFFPGRPLGIRDDQGAGCRRGVVPSSPCTADNRRVLNDTAFTVANFRQGR